MKQMEAAMEKKLFFEVLLQNNSNNNNTNNNINKCTKELFYQESHRLKACNSTKKGNPNRYF